MIITIVINYALWLKLIKVSLGVLWNKINRSKLDVTYLCMFTHVLSGTLIHLHRFFIDGLKLLLGDGAIRLAQRFFNLT